MGSGSNEKREGEGKATRKKISLEDLATKKNMMFSTWTDFVLRIVASPPASKEAVKPQLINLA